MKIIGNKHGLDLTWSITNKCNYACDYCLIPKGNKFAEKEIIHELNKYADKIRYLVLFGGEPTLHPDLNYIIDNCNCRLKLWSNLSADISFYNSLPDKVNLICTYHSHIPIEIFLSKISKLKKKPNCHIPISHLFKKESYIYIKKYTNKCETIPIVGIDNYYKDTNELYQNIQNYETKVTIIDNNEIQELNIDNFYKLDYFKTIFVFCDINKYCIDLKIDNKFYACYHSFNTLDEAYNFNLICRNARCNACFMSIGEKNGIFKISDSSKGLE